MQTQLDFLHFPGSEVTRQAGKRGGNFQKVPTLEDGQAVLDPLLHRQRDSLSAHTEMEDEEDQAREDQAGTDKLMLIKRSRHLETNACLALPCLASPLSEAHASLTLQPAQTQLLPILIEPRAPQSLVVS